MTVRSCPACVWRCHLLHGRQQRLRQRRRRQRTYAFTGYGSSLVDNGMFVDVTGKVGRLKNRFDISTTLGTASGSYNTNAFSLSAEAGWRLHPLDNSLYVEPQVEMMYGRVLDADYTTSMGVAVEHEAVDTLIGRVGFVLGLKCPNNRGNTYVRASILHDWQGDAESTFTKGGQTKHISEELGDTWLEYGVGANFTPRRTCILCGP
ncbi:MAG: autotransporter outer membrane beta-barrel domain-containing protein [Sutterella wadsworthensis]